MQSSLFLSCDIFQPAPGRDLALTAQRRSASHSMQPLREPSSACLRPCPALRLPPLLSVSTQAAVSSFVSQRKLISIFLCRADLILSPCILWNSTTGSPVARAGCWTGARDAPCVLILPGFNCCSAVTFQRDASLLLLLCRACLWFFPAGCCLSPGAFANECSMLMTSPL